MKKFLTKLVAVVMATGLLPAIPASANDANYNFVLNDWVPSGTSTEDVYMEVEPGTGRTGNGLVCRFNEGATGKLQYYQSFSTLAGGDYRCTFWAKGTSAAWKLAVSPWWITTSGGLYYMHSSNYTGNKDGDWLEYSYTFTLDGTKTNPTFRINMEGVTDAVIDDISLYKITKDAATGEEIVEGNNLMKNGGFEYTGKPNVTETANDAKIEDWNITYTELSGYNAFVVASEKIGYDDSNSLYVYGDYKWKSGENKKITITSAQMNFDTTKQYTVSFYTNAKSGLGDTGVYIEGTGEFSRMTGMKTGEVDNRGWEKMSYTLTPKAGGNKRLGFTFYSAPEMYIDNISVVCNDNPDVNLMKNGSFTSYYFPADGIEDNEKEVSEWYTQYTGVDDYTAYTAVAEDFGYNSDSSMYFYGDYKWVSGENKYIDLRTLPIKLQGGKNYIFSCYVNEVKSTIGNTHVSFDGASNAIMSNMTIGSADHDGWKKITHTFAVSSDAVKSLKFLFWSTPSMYMDQVSLVCEDNPEINLIGNGSFEEYEELPVKATNAYAADSWTVNAVGSSVADKFENTVFAEPSATYKKSGEYSMLFAFPEARADHTYLNTIYPIDIAAGEYTLAFYTKGSYEPSGMQIVFRKADGGFAEQIRGNGGNPTNMSISNISYEDGWRKYEFKVNAQDVRKGFSILCDNRVDYLYIDDISITKDGVNYISNGGFENVKSVNIDEIENFMAYPVNAGGAVNVSWVNPKNDDIELKLYVNNELVEGFEYDETSKAFNEYLVSDLANWQTYTFKMEVFVDGNEEPKTFETKAIPRTGAMKINNWTANRGDNQAYGNVTFEVDRTVGYNSNTAIKINSNRNGVLSNNYGQLMQSVTIDTSYPYELKFMAKAKGLRSKDSLYTILDCGAGSVWKHMYADDDLVDVTFGAPDENGWMEYSYVIEPLEHGVTNVNFRIGFADWADEIYIDDVQLYQLDLNEYEPVTDNLIADGGFEFPNVIVGNMSVSYEVEKDTWLSGIDKMWGAGNYKASVSVGNISEPTPLHVTLILAVYDAEGRLVSATPSTAYVVQNQWATTGVSASASVEDGQTVKAMLWKGNDWSMVPMASSLEVLNK